MAFVKPFLKTIQKHRKRAQTLDNARLQTYVCGDKLILNHT